MQHQVGKAKRPLRPCSAQEGIWMSGEPSIVPLVGCRALIALVSYVQWLLGAVGGLSIAYWTRGVKISPSSSQLRLPEEGSPPREVP